MLTRAYLNANPFPTDLVFVEIKKKTKDAVLLLVEKERESELIDRALVKNILGIFIELGMGGMDVSAWGPGGGGGGGRR